VVLGGGQDSRLATPDELKGYMKPLLIIVLALVGCASKSERTPRRYCMVNPGHWRVVNGEARWSCDDWCKTRGGCLCNAACPCIDWKN
jgi:hypothetical protein